MKTATLVKTHPQRVSSEYCRYGKAALYKLSEPLAYDSDKPPCEFVFVSTSNPGRGWETYAFPSDETGDCLSWAELDGSETGTLSHDVVLGNIGYRLDEVAA